MRRNITDNARTITLVIAFTATNRYTKHIHLTIFQWRFTLRRSVLCVLQHKMNIDFLQRGLNSQFTLSIGFFNTMATLDVVL